MDQLDELGDRLIAFERFGVIVLRAFAGFAMAAGALVTIDGIAAGGVGDGYGCADAQQQKCR